MPIDHFEILAPWYDRAIRSRLTPDLLELLNPTPASRVLDAAGGTGRLALPLRAHAAQVVVADIAAGMLAQARGKGGLAVVRASTDALPFQARSFDRVLIVDALHHIRAQQEAVHQLWRVLKPGGRLLIEEPDIADFPVKLIALAETLAGMGSRFLRREQISALFAGLPGRAGWQRKDHTIWVWIDR
jgi:demethylmenaquinone methyltransferase/2-methoxy-6-polyprenyl-1,4-benzoquinol methylase